LIVSNFHEFIAKHKARQPRLGLFRSWSRLQDSEGKMETHKWSIFAVAKDDDPAGAQVEEAVQVRMRKSAYLELRRISTTFRGGVLSLHGNVSSYYLRQMAQALVQGLEGIEEIDNQLEVTAPRNSRVNFRFD
jgi:osmotically-inducible protein OsmY